jgi:hypothetical protein
MEINELRGHAIAFADWKKEWESNEHHRWHRYVRKHGMPTVVGPTTAEIYDKWINRTVMTFQEAMDIVHAGGFVTRPRMDAVHESSIRLKDGVPFIFIKEDGFRVPYSEKCGYPDDKTATDWYQLSNQ